MKSNAIEIFLIIYEQKSLSLAAKELFFSKQNVSKSLKGLESELGIQLFNRYKGGLIPTPECDELYNILRYLKANIENIEEYYKLKKNPCSVRIADNNFESITRCFNKAIEKYCDDEVLYSFENIDSEEIYRMLLNNQCEIGIFVAPKLKEDKIKKACEGKNITLETILETEPSIVIGENHPLADREYLTPKDLKSFKRIDLVRPNEKSGFFNKYLKANKINVEVDMKTTGIANIITSLQLIDYYFISVYSKVDKNYLDGLKMIPLKETGLELKMFLGYNKEASYDKVSEYFMNLVREYYRGEDSED